jgi:dipeptidase D
MTELPTGVIAMSEDIPGLVETSLNMGIARLDNAGPFTLSFSVRSAKGAAKEELVKRLSDFSGSVGAKFSTRGAYPAWEYRKDSHLRDVMCEVYRNMYGKDACVVTIHAGLECGIFSDKLPGLDCVSIGPDNFDIHTPEEHLSLSSTARVWEYLITVLKSI